MRPIHMPLSVRGRVRWGVYNERGEREPVRVTYPDGREALLSGGYWQPNLITNLGMNAFAETANGWVGLNGTLATSVRRYGRIGTGSSVPAFSDTALDNQVMYSNTAAPFSDNSVSGSEDGSNLTIHAMRRVTFVMDQNRNLTEFGFGKTEGGEFVEDPPDSGIFVWEDWNDIYVRELFRDSGGTPITLSILSGKTLRIDHMYDITLDMSLQTGSFDVHEYDAANNFVSTTSVDYHARWYTIRTSAGTPTENAMNMRVGVTGIVAAANFAVNTGMAYSTTLNPDITSGPHLGTTPTGYSLAWSSNWGSGGVVISNRPYTAGSHERVYDMVVTAAQGNFAWTGWGSWIRTSSMPQRGGGFIVAFRNDHAFTKVDTHTLRWSIKWSWARG